MIILDRRLSSEGGKWLFSCLIDFIVQPAWLTYAMIPRPVPIIDRELVAAPSGSASGMAGWLKERPDHVPRWHLVPVFESPRLATG